MTPKPNPSSEPSTLSEAESEASSQPRQETPRPSSAQDSDNGHLANPEEPLGESGSSPNVAGVRVDLDYPRQDALPTLPGKIKTILIGKPRDLADKSVYAHISLVAFLAWVGLGADGLSSSCYGPAEAFKNLGEHRYLAVILAAAIVATVFIISICYSHIIEEFPSGGGGYLVASKLLGRRIGVVSGCALLVDYVMTITVSIASAGDALFSLLSEVNPHLVYWKLPAEAALIVGLIVLNLRGVKESVQFLLPIFMTFLIAHVIVIAGAIVLHLPNFHVVAGELSAEVHRNVSNPTFGLIGMLALLLHAYSLGGGTYTGLEAVSNSMPVIREPRVANAKRTMLYMAISLSFTAAGLIIAYLLLGIEASEDPTKTMNYLLTQRFVGEVGFGEHWFGSTFVIVTLVSEGALLIVAALAGFIDGPRVLGYMAHDSWMPRWFASLSERLATENGILLMGLAALAALWYTHGNIDMLIVMYSINVFLTFSLSMIGMCRHWWELRNENPLWRRRLALFLVGALLCVSILVITVFQKAAEGGWVTIVVTSLCVAVAFAIHRYYDRVGAKLKILDETLRHIPTSGEPTDRPLQPAEPTAVILVGGYSGLGIHTLLNVVRFAPNYFKNFIFISAGVVDSGNFKGSGAVEELKSHTAGQLERYVDLSRRLGIPAASYMAIGTDAVEELERLCLDVAKEYPRATVFAGQLVFQRDTWVHRFLHNQTAYSLQRRLQWVGIPMVILPTRVR